MALLKRLRFSLLLELFFDATLLLLFILQALIVGCLLIYGYLPFPAEWGNRIISEKLPASVVFKVNEFRIGLRGNLELVGIEIRSSQIKQNLLEAESAEVELKWKGLKQLPTPDSLVLSRGTLYMPSVYSPDGYRQPILKRIAFRLVPSEEHWTVDRFAALHDDIRLRGTFEFASKQNKAHNTDLSDQDITKSIQAFYTQAAKLSQQKEVIAHFSTPTIAFKFQAITPNSQKVELRISSHRLHHPEIQATDVQLLSTIKFRNGDIIPLTAPRLTTKQLELPRHQITTEGLSAEFPRTELSSILTGRWPRINLAANHIKLQAFDLNAPTLQINPQYYPELTFHGSTRSLNGAIDFNGAINVKDQSGHAYARGSVDLVKLVPKDMQKNLPSITYDTPPYLDVNVEFETGFTLNQAELKAQIIDLQIEELTFDYIDAHASYKDDQYTVEDLYLRRQQQWIDLKLNYDSDSADYKVSLIGSAVPYEYNPLLPQWWATIFQDFDFSQTDYSLGDFIIYGNTQRKAADLYYGHAEARNVSYRGVALDEGELIVRGRGPYCELHQLSARKEQAWANGNIAFSSRMGDRKGPVSIRLDMEARLTLEDAAKLFQGNVANILADFKTKALPIAKLKGALFGRNYPEYADKSYFDLSAELDAPLTFKGVPLDYLSFDLYGRSNVTHLRNVQLGYAKGQGSAKIDVLTPSESTNSLLYQFELKDADQTNALKNLPQLNPLEDSLETTQQNTANPSNNHTALVDIMVHGQGPVDDPFMHKGFGQFEIRNDKLGTIQLLGPLSKFLQNTHFNFTSFNLNKMRGNFRYENEIVTFDPLRIDGDRTRINAPGTLNLGNQAVDMQVNVSLFGNYGNPQSNLRKISNLLIKKLPNLLEFELTGTINNQKLRSLYDPRNLIPLFE